LLQPEGRLKSRPFTFAQYSSHFIAVLLSTLATPIAHVGSPGTLRGVGGYSSGRPSCCPSRGQPLRSTWRKTSRQLPCGQLGRSTTSFRRSGIGCLAMI